MSKSGIVEPTFLHAPKFHKTYGPDVADLCAAAYFPPDPQQRLALDLTFARDERGLSAAFEVATIVGRQNMKSGFFKQCILGWLYLFDERLVVYSAHEFSTAMEIFRDIDQLVTGVDLLRRQTKRIIRNHGEEGIETATGGRLMIKTRTKGGGRGLSARKVILDEAYALRAMHMGALLPTLSAQPDPQVMYGSAAGMADSDVLRDLRDRGRADVSADPRLAYLEWCAPDPELACQAGKGCTHAKNATGCGCDKPDLWLKANPTIGDRMSVAYVTAERRAMPVDEFRRERMGWWDDPLEGGRPMSVDDWYARADRQSTPDTGFFLSLGFAVAPDSSMSAIAVAGWRPDPEDPGNPDLSIVHVELAEHLPGTGWLLDKVLAITERQKPFCVCFDPSTPAGSLEQNLRAAGFVTKAKDEKAKMMPGQKLMLIASQREYAQACVGMAHDVANDRIRHPDQAPLNLAAENARSRPVSHAWGWDPECGYDITPLVAVTMAKLGLDTYGRRRKPRPFSFYE
jgi:hypothetical protein